MTDKRAILGEWSSGADFVSNVVAGLLLGLFLDWWLGTSPSTSYGTATRRTTRLLISAPSRFRTSSSAGR